MPGTKITLKARKARYFLGARISSSIIESSMTGRVPSVLGQVLVSDRTIARSLFSTRMERSAGLDAFGPYTGQSGDLSVADIPNVLRSP